MWVFLRHWWIYLFNIAFTSLGPQLFRFLSPSADAYLYDTLQSKDTANKSNERTIHSLYNGHWTTEWSFPWSIDKFWSIYFWFGLPNKKVIYEYSWLASEKAIKKIPHIRLNFVKTLLCGLIIQSLCNRCLKLKSLIIMFNVCVFGM